MAQAAPPPERLASLDAYRGFAMLLMASHGLGISAVAEHFTQSRVWQFLAYQTEHVAWIGCTVWDLIQPSFLFLVGAAMPFSLASRTARGQSFKRQLLHAVLRAVILCALGIFLRSVGRESTNFTFEDVLTQIGLGYVALFLLAHTSRKAQVVAVVLVLAGYWAAFALTPLPPANFNPSEVGLGPDWKRLEGFEAHWEKNTNLAHQADVAFLNWFPRSQPFLYNGGGYQTLNFVPSLATMLLGLLAGQWLRGPRSVHDKTVKLALAGAAGLAAGWLVGAVGLCPVVKRIWTPSWVIFSAGWTCLFLALFHAVLDGLRIRAWAFPLKVVGMNSISMYCLAHLVNGFLASSLRTHLGQDVFSWPLGAVYAPLVEHLAVPGILWCLLLWMYRRKLFLRI